MVDIVKHEALVPEIKRKDLRFRIAAFIYALLLERSLVIIHIPILKMLFMIGFLNVQRIQKELMDLE